MDDGGGEIDHRFEAFVGFVASQGDAFEVLQFAEEVLDQMAPFVNVPVDVERVGAPLMLRDDDLGFAFIHLLDDPVRVEGLVGDQPAELDVVNQRRDADGVKAMTRQQRETDQVSQRIGQGEDFRGPAAL